VAAIACSNNGATFATVGPQHFTFWSFGGDSASGALPVECRPADLGSELKASEFADVVFSCRKTDADPIPAAVYGLTKSGHLCYIRPNRKLEKWVDLQVSAGFALSASASHVACACAEGTVRVFATHTLAYATTLPFPAPEGRHGLTGMHTCAHTFSPAWMNQ
jgi:hypothetical protein